MKELLLVVMLLLVPARAQEHRGEEADAAKDRYARIAQAVAEEAKGDQRLAAFLLSIAKHESTYARAVHSGKKRGDGGRSYGLFQLQLPRMAIHHTDVRIPDHPKGWRGKDIVGTDFESTRRAVWTAAWVLRPKVKACHGNAECVFRSYGGLPPRGALKPKVKERIDGRVETYFKVRRLMKKKG